MAASDRQSELWPGLLCIGIGGLTLFEANRYSIGTLGNMGPGFYPAVLGGLMSLVGVLIIVAGSARTAEDPLHAMPAGAEWRGRLCIVAGVVLFIACAQTLGLVIATFACVFVAALGDRKATLRSALLLATGVTVFGVTLFAELLGVNLPVWP